MLPHARPQRAPGSTKTITLMSHGEPGGGWHLLLFENTFHVAQLTVDAWAVRVVGWRTGQGTMQPAYCIRAGAKSSLDQQANSLQLLFTPPFIHALRTLQAACGRITSARLW